MSPFRGLNQHRFLLGLLLAMVGAQNQSCGIGGRGDAPGPAALAGRGGATFGSGGFGALDAGASAAAASRDGSAGTAIVGGTAGALGYGGLIDGGSFSRGGGSAFAGGAGTTGASAGSASGGSAGYTVSIVQSDKPQASDLTQDDVRSLVTEAVAQAGGLDFVKDGQTVVLKPNLLTTSSGGALLSATVNGITTDWRVTHAVAALVRARNPSGKIFVMEGSIESTTQAYSRMGYTQQNFGTLVDEFIALEGASCNQTSGSGLVQKAAAGGKLYWVNQRFFDADIVISLAVLKTHLQAGVTGSVKNIGVGATPANKYSNNGCARTQTAAYIDHGRAGLAAFIHDFYSIRPADFAIIDGLQGIQNGPSPAFVPGGNYDADRMNMRLVMASRNAVALDTIEALVMGCDPKSVDHLLKLDQSGFGTSDAAKIRVLGKAVSAVRREFKGPDWACGNP